MIAIFFSKICRDETIRMIYFLPEMDKNFQRYFASNNEMREKRGWVELAI